MHRTATARPAAPAHGAAAISPWLLALTSAVGPGRVLLPVLPPAGRSGETAAHAADAPLLLVGCWSGLCVLVLLADLETRRLDAKQVALLGMLVATNAVLRPFQGPGGLSPIFVLPILTGYVFGAGFGFLLGSLSMLVSALFTAGRGAVAALPDVRAGLGGAGSRRGWPGPAAALARRGVDERWTLAAWGRADRAAASAR